MRASKVYGLSEAGVLAHLVEDGLVPAQAQVYLTGSQVTARRAGQAIIA